MKELARTLLNNVLYFKNNEVTSGFIYFNNERIIDTGLEPSPEYELSELVINYENGALAIHGFSVAIDVFKYILKNKYSRETIDTLSNSELEKIVNNVLYELYLNGVTLPVIHSYRIDIVNKVIKENNLEAVLIHSGELREYNDVHYIVVEDNQLIHRDRVLGDIDTTICRYESLTSNCLFIDTTDSLTQNVSFIINNLLRKTNNSFEQAISLLYKPYVSLGIDNGELLNGSKPDIVIHDLRNSLKTLPRSIVKYVLLKGYVPEQVFVKGDLFFDRGEPLVLFQHKIYSIIFDKQ